MQSTWRILAAFLVWVLIWSATMVRAAAPPDATIPRVPNPPLAHRPRPTCRATCGRSRCPAPSNLGEFVKDPAMALALGKALFWDMQVGSDGVQACASCHFRAGADPRSKNQVSPGLKHVPDAGPRLHRPARPELPARGRGLPADPARDPGVRGALDPATDSNDVVSSQGVHLPRRRALDPLGFHVGGANTRRVEPRNTPIGDQRGLQPPPVLGRPRRERLQRRQPPRRSAIPNATRRSRRRPAATRSRSASSSSTRASPRRRWPRSSATSRWPRRAAPARRGPRRSPAQRNSASGRDGPSAGQAAGRTDRQRARPAQPLAAARASRSTRYDEMIQAAFHEQVVEARASSSASPPTARVTLSSTSEDSDRGDPTRYSLIQYNFSLFFGLAVQLYEATLVVRRHAVGSLPPRAPVADRPGAQPVDQHRPRPHQPPRALRRASVQRPHPRPDERPLLELPRAGRADRRLGRAASPPPPTARCATATATSSTRASTTSASAPPPTTSASAPATRSARSRTRAASSPARRRPRSTARP